MKAIVIAAVLFAVAASAEERTVKPAKPLQKKVRRIPVPGPAKNPPRNSIVAKKAGAAHPVRPPAPVLNNARHRGANPAVISGTAILSTRSNGVIDGRQIHRQP